MNQDNVASPSANFTELSRKSWTAYIGLTVALLLVLWIIGTMAWSASPIAGVAVVVVSVGYYVYRVLFLRSFRLYCDDVGVWVYSGVFPWNKGVRGVKWRDLDEAVYAQTFWSWMFKSYSVRIGHRFTKGAEIFLTHMARGHESVMQVNEQHQEMVRANALT